MSFEEDDGLSGYVAELLEGGCLEGAEEGVAKRFLANEPLSPDQQKVFDRYVIAKHDPGSCIRGCDIPWSENMKPYTTAGCAATALI